MSKAVVDPGELRQFARDLKRFNTEIDERARLMQARFAALSQSWRDQEQRKFAEEFEQMMRRPGPIHQGQRRARPLPPPQGRPHRRVPRPAMSQHARVRSIDALSRLRAAIAVFAEEADQALIAVDAEIARHPARRRR